MRQVITSLSRIFIILIIIVLPVTALGQSQLSSSNFKLDNINFGTNFTLVANSSATPPEISAEGPTVVELTPTTAKITWKTDKKSSSTIEYGTSSDYGLETGNSQLVTEHTITIFGLSPETEYHYRVKSTDAFGISSNSSDKTFTTPAEAGINSIKVSDITYDKALVTWTTGLFTTSKVEYGTTTSYGQSLSASSRGFVTSHTLQLTNLKSGTDYHFRIVAEDEKGNITRSSDLIFTTIAEPVFISVNASVTSANEATITWRTNVFTTGIIAYKSDKDKEQQTAGDPASAREHTIILKNLYGLTDYAYTVTATDAQGRQVKTSNRAFKTLADSEAPKIDTLKVNVTRSGEELVMTATWKTNEPAKSVVSYNPKNNTQDVTQLPESSQFITDHVVVATGLKASTPYALRVIVTDPFNNQSEETINFVSPGLRKSIFQLIIDSILKPFGWLADLFS